MTPEYQVLERFETIGDWTLLNDETETLAASTATVFGTSCISFAKVAGDTTLAGAYKTFATPYNLTSRIGAKEWLGWQVYVGATTNVAYAFLRLGTLDADGTTISNYCEWRFLVAGITALRWQLCMVRVGDAFITGTGWDPSKIDYCAVGVAFNANANTLAGIRCDELFLTRSYLA